MASLAPFEDLAADFTCPVCLEWLWEPVTLPCGHLYCRACIEMAWESPPESGLCCPQCRETFPDKQYAPCRLLGTLIQRIRTMEAAGGEEAQHERGSGGGGSRDRRGGSWWRNSRSRTVFSVQESRKFYEEKLSSAVSELEENLAGLHILRKREEKKLEDQKEIMHSLDFNISFLFRQLHYFLNARERACKAKLKKEGGRLLQEIEEKLKAMREACEMNHTLMMEAEEHQQLQDSASFLMEVQPLLNRMKQQQIPQPASVIQATMKLLGQFNGPLHFVAWRKMRSALNIDFPQITLDPDTAHPCLVISDNGTCVQDGKIRQDVPDTPKRFDYCVAVLGCEGFSSGRHYWEVEVGDKPSWTLGLVNTSSNRKGKIDASPQNGYWVIRLKNGMELVAKDSSPEKLCPSTFPKRVGVYLDYNVGIVSFYDASTMDCLYTFLNQKFKEKLFPYFCPGLYNSGGNATPLKICHFIL